MYFCACHTPLPEQLNKPFSYESFYAAPAEDPLLERFAVVLEDRLLIFLVMEYPAEQEHLNRFLNQPGLDAGADACQWQANDRAVELFFETALDISINMPIDNRLRSIRQSIGALEQHTPYSPFIHNLYWRILWLYEKIRLEFDFYKIPTNPSRAFSQLIHKIYDPNTRPQLALAGNSAPLMQLLRETGTHHFSRIFSFRAGQNGQVVSLMEKLRGDVFLISDDMDSSAVVNHLKRQLQYTRLPILVICNSATLQKKLEKSTDIFCYTLTDLENIVSGYRKEKEQLIRQARMMFAQETDSFFGWASSGKRDNFMGIISRHPSMYRLFETIVRVSPNNITVLIEGPSGTGKELIARSIHRLSNRRHQPFITVNCSAIPDNLLESELFGHVKGAFTGAVANKMGLFHEANNGTIFLDEIGELSEGLQVKLLRFLQNGEIRPVGGNQTIRIDTRLITATNRNLRQRVDEGFFRSDFYYRLNVVKLTLPALKERKEDIELLCTHFIHLFSQKFNKEINGIEQEALRALSLHDWPGNVRELENVIEHACAMTLGSIITRDDLPQLHGSAGPTLSPDDEGALKTLKDMENEHIRKALLKYGANYDAICRELAISRTTLWRKLKELNIS